MVLKFERLPTTVVPSHYKLFIKPDLVKCVFEGQVTIDLMVKESTQRIVLNSLQLELGHIELQLQDGSLFLPSQVVQSVEDETITIVFASAVPIGPCKLSISFKGQLLDSLMGLYRSKYTSPDGEEHFCAVTQFESCSAHRCFPCWDEPAIKATFDISLCVPKDRVALSNMPILREEEQPDGLRLVHFSKTPVMSTYLVAVVVGEFDYLEDISSDGVRVRVYTPIGKTEQGQFALKVAVKVLPYFKDYFQIAYPIPKIDLVAIANFSAGAMENWGLVTYREACLLVDPKNSSTQQKQCISLIVAHELAHQWFGNLVTMEWWTHLWLNEGYATFAEFLCVAHIFPKFDIWTQFVTDTFNTALKLDSLKNSHPIEVPIGHPAEVDEIFDDISYCKGASVIRMLHNYLGEAHFREGMTLYLNRYLYRNATTEDLWKALEEASKKPVSAVMPTWTKQMGYPVVSVQSEQVGNDRKLKLHQTKFCADGGSGIEGTGSQMWMVPIEISSSKSSSEVIHKFILEGKETELTLHDVSEDTWVKLNPGAVGFFRVQYSAEMLEKLYPVISDQSLPPLDRLNILDDLFALVQAGHARTDQVLQLLLSMENESNYCVWTCISSVLKKLKLLLQYADDVYPKFLAFGRRVLQKASQSINWDPQPEEGHQEKLLRNVLLDLLVAFEDEAARAESQKRFTAHVDGSAPLFPDIRSTVYRAVLRNANATTYNTFLKMYREEVLQEEKNRITYALASMADEDLLKLLIEFALSNEVRTQNSLSIISSVAQSRVGRDMVWEFIKEKWDELCKNYNGMFLLPDFLKSSLSHFVSEEKAEEVEKFCHGRNLTGLERSVQIAVERIHLNAAWLKRDLPCVSAFLKELK